MPRTKEISLSDYRERTVDAHKDAYKKLLQRCRLKNWSEKHDRGI